MALINWNGWSWPRLGRGAQNRNNFEVEPTFIGEGVSGAPISIETALQTSAMLCGARVIAQGVAQVPLKLFETGEDELGRQTRKIRRDHPAYRLLSEAPNDFQTSFSFRETMVLHAIFTHGGYAYISRNRTGQILELLPILPDHIKPVWNTEKRELEYEWNSGDDADLRLLKPKDVLHLRGPSWDGFSGLKALDLAKEAVGLSRSLQKSQADISRKGGRPSGVLSTEGTLSPEALDRMRQVWTQRFGPNGDGGIAVLDSDWRFHPVQMSAVEGQNIETRRFQIEEVARFLVIFPQMLMQADKTATYASATEFFRAHVVHTLDPWMVRLEGEISRTVLQDDPDIQAKLIRDGLMRGSPLERAEYYKAALGAGNAPAWLTQNEVRALENQDPLLNGSADQLPQQAAIEVGSSDDT